jgi:hypothetical protein
MLLTIEGHPALVDKQETTMTTRTSKTNRSALALTAAVLATATFIVGSASAMPKLQGNDPMVTGAAPTKPLGIRPLPLPPGGGNGPTGIHPLPLPPVVGTGPGVRPLPPTPVVGTGGGFHPLPLPPPPGLGHGPRPPVGGIPVPPPQPGSGSGGGLVSCQIGKGCVTPGHDHDHDRDHDHDYDRDHDRDYDRDHGWYRHWGFWHHDDWHWRLPPVYSVDVDTTCTYAYKWTSAYVPGFGLRRVLFKECVTS